MIKEFGSPRIFTAYWIASKYRKEKTSEFFYFSSYRRAKLGPVPSPSRQDVWRCLIGKITAKSLNWIKYSAIRSTQPNFFIESFFFSSFQIGSSTLSNSMPQPSGVRSYQIVNDGTDDQYVRSATKTKRKARRRQFSSLGSLRIHPIDFPHDRHLDLHCSHSWFSSFGLLLETTLVSPMLLRPSRSGHRSVRFAQGKKTTLSLSSLFALEQRSDRTTINTCRIAINNGMSKRCSSLITFNHPVIQTIISRSTSDNKNQSFDHFRCI